MTSEIEKLKEQIEKLQKTVESLENGSREIVKKPSANFQYRTMRMKMFHKYFHTNKGEFDSTHTYYDVMSYIGLLTGQIFSGNHPHFNSRHFPTILFGEKGEKPNSELIDEYKNIYESFCKLSFDLITKGGDE